MSRPPEREFRALVENAIMFNAQGKINAQGKDCGDRATFHMGRYVFALDMIREIARPDMKVVDVASYGAIAPALHQVLGIRDVTVTNVPEYGAEPRGEMHLRLTPGGIPVSFPYHRFDIEEAFPYPDATFDLVIMTEVLEHITRDPMHTLGEINRISAAGGWLLLSTPNSASLRSVAKAMRGQQPYIWSQYSKMGHRDRHNREYAPCEVQQVLECAGYRVTELKTSNDSYGGPQRGIRRGIKWLANRGLAIASLVAGSYVSPALRGESTYALARKEGPVKCRFPEFLYY